MWKFIGFVCLVGAILIGLSMSFWVGAFMGFDAANKAGIEHDKR